MVFKKTRYIGIVIGRHEKNYIGILLVSADKKIVFIGLYRYQPIWKKCIGRTLNIDKLKFT